MNLDEIKELIAVMRKNRIQEIDLEQAGTKVRIVAAEAHPAAPPAPIQVPVYMQAPAAQPMMAAPAAAPGWAPAAAAAVSQAAATPAAAAAPEMKGTEVKSPMVGTFYRSPAPDVSPYVEVGQTVGNDTVLCIVEAMKLMNEIKAEMRGKILKVLVENGQPVEFGQPLFLVESL
jgi:acetyl-CoA carboxylase biotin carboxyl carrier protein